MNRPPGDITHLLQRMSAGDREAERDVVALVYGELRRLAASYMRVERDDHTLQPTALVHEAYLGLVKQREVQWRGRAHFFAIAATIMRRILVDYARARLAQKGPGQFQKVSLEGALGFPEERPAELLALHDALERLAGWDPRQSRIVELRFFGGLSEEEIGEVLGISARQVGRDWSMAKAWLHGELA